MTTQAYVVRHAERIDRVDKNWLRKAGHQRDDDPHLSPKGELQIQRLAARFVPKAECIAQIFCSPFIRCVQTANAVATAVNDKRRSCGLPPLRLCVEPGICEFMFRFPPKFLSVQELSERFPLIDPTYTPVCATFDLTYEPSEELGWDRSDRAMRTLMARLDEQRTQSGNTIVLVGHGASCIGMSQALGGSGTFQNLCTVTKFERTSAPPPSSSPQQPADGPASTSSWICKYTGDSSHLPRELKAEKW